MTLRSLLVHLDDDARCDVRMHLALRLAATHGCHLLGAATTGRIELSSGIGAASHYIEDADVARDDALHRASQAVQRFLQRCKAEGLPSVDAQVHEGDKAAVVLHHANGTDLTIIGQADPASPGHREQRRFVEHVLLHNARPTLLVPHDGRFEQAGDNVLIAWDESRGAARATADALPVLRRAREVHLRILRRHGEVPEQLIRERLPALQRWLGWQDVKADVQVETTTAGIGEAILHSAQRLGADLIVMGTYGHSRWTERVLGGATRTALAHSPLPLLMSH